MNYEKTNKNSSYTERLGTLPIWAIKMVRPGFQVPMQPRSAEQQAPLPTVMSQGVPLDVLHTISIGSDRSSTQRSGFSSPEQAVGMIEGATQSYAIVREPYGDKTSLIKLTPEELESGYCDYDAVPDRHQGMIPQAGEEPLTLSVLKDPNNQMSQPEQVAISNQYSQLMIQLAGNRPEAYAVVV